MDDQSMNQSMNIGSEIRLYDGCVKNIKIGSIKMIRQVRQLMKDKIYKFSASIGRDKWEANGERKEIDWPSIESAYKQAFALVLEGGLSDEEYDNVDEEGIKELDNLLDRFL